MGLIDEIQKQTADAIAAKAVALIQQENWMDAHDARNELLNYIQNVTGLATLYNIGRKIAYHVTANGTDYLKDFMNRKDVQISLLKAEPGVWEDCNSTVGARLASDVPKSTMHLVEFLLNHSVPVLLYQGQFDLRDGVSSNEAWIRLLKWKELDSFYASERKVWQEDGLTVGYVRSFSFLTHVVISDAGHLVPTDQAYASQQMIEHWITSKGSV
ncbi:hypothetical protein KP509_07G068100 [Ceratopteris richardii]|nr:hypothetical protein KP509_07G068100 [Ceratopteris richardii]